MQPLTCDDTARTDPFTVLSLWFHHRLPAHSSLTCGNARLTPPRDRRYLSPRSKQSKESTRRAGRAAGTSQDEPDARDPGGSARIRVGPRPPEKAARPDPVGPAGNAARRVRAGGPRETGRCEAIRSPRKAEASRKANHRRRSGNRAETAEVAWGTRAREAEGGWELRFPASWRSLGFSLFRSRSLASRVHFSVSVPAP